MAQHASRTVLRQLRKLVPEPAMSRRSDQQLLRHFIVEHDEGAFAELLRRHGPMVLDAARCVLHNQHDAEDVYQATFLVLARKAAAIRKQTSLASWLYGVAYRLAMKARTSAARRHNREGQKTSEVSKTSEVFSDSVMDEMTWREFRLILHEELHRLPDKYRSPLLLCYFEGKTQDESADQLGWNKWTLKDRLDQARELLRTRLTRRGVIPSAALFATLLARDAASAVPTALVDAMLHAASLLVAGKPIAGVVSAHAAALGDQAIRAMAFSKAKLAVGMIFAFGMIAAGTGFAAYQISKDDPPQETKLPRPDSLARDEIPARLPPKNQPRNEFYGDPVPPGALMRLGTLRLRLGSMVHSLAFSPDGNTIASGADDSTLRLWDAKTGKEIRRFPGHRAGVQTVAFSPDSQTLASGSGDQSIRLWQIGSGKEIRQFSGHQNYVTSLAFSPDGKTIVSGSDDKTIRLWDIATGREVSQIVGHSERITSVAFSPHGRVLASAGHDSMVRLWDLATGNQLGKFELDIPVALAFSPDGRTLIAGGRERGVPLWDIATGRELRRFDAPNGWVNCLGFSANGQMVAAGCGNRIVCLWEASTGKELRQFHGHQLHVKSVAFSPDNKTLASGGEDQTIRVWEIATGKEILPFGGHQGAVSAVAFSPDRKLLATAGGDHAVRLWDVRSGKELRQLRGDQYWIKTVAFSPDGKTLASGGGDGAIHLWEVENGKELRRFGNLNTWIYHLAFSPDGMTLAVSRDDQLIDLYDIVSGQRLRQFPGESRYPTLAFSPNGKVLALGCKDGNIRLWDANTGKEIRRFGSYPNEIRCLVFSPDGKLIASPGNNSNDYICLWEAASGKVAYHLSGSGQGAISLAFAPDGKMLAAGNAWSDIIVLWELRSGKECSRFVGQHCWWNSSLAFSPDGRTLASGTDDTTVVLWDVTGRSPAGNLPAINLSPRNLETLWKDLAGEDARKATEAFWAMVAGSQQSVPFLREHLPPVLPIDMEAQMQINRWLSELDSGQFNVRDKATHELEKLGEKVGPAIRFALKGKPSLEAGRRLRQLLEKLEGNPLPRDRLREVRAVEVLEHIGTAEAMQLLQVFAAGQSEARLTQEAIASLDRLGKRPAADP